MRSNIKQNIYHGDSLTVPSGTLMPEEKEELSLCLLFGETQITMELLRLERSVRMAPEDEWEANLADLRARRERIRKMIQFLL